LFNKKFSSFSFLIFSFLSFSAFFCNSRALFLAISERLFCTGTTFSCSTHNIEAFIKLSFGEMKIIQETQITNIHSIQ